MSASPQKVITILFGDESSVDEIVNSAFKSNHAVSPSRLDHGRYLMSFTFTNEVRHSRNINENLHDGDSPLTVCAWHQCLRHYAPQTFREHDSNLRLLTFREHVYDPIHCFDGAVGVKRAEHKVTRFRSRDG